MPAPPDVDSTSKAASKKKRKNKKKHADKNATSNGAVEASEAQNGVEDDAEGDGEGEDEEDTTSRKPSIGDPAPISRPETQPEAPNPPDPTPETTSEVRASPEPTTQDLPLRNGAREHEEAVVAPSKPASDPHEEHAEGSTQPETSELLEAMVRERDRLRVEVAELRRSLETVRERHDEEVSGLKEEADNAQTAKESAEVQYRTLLGKVNTIRSQLGERLKADAEELSQARAQIEQLQEDNQNLHETQAEHRANIARLASDKKSQSEELDALRGRSNLSQSNWFKERDDLNSQLAFAREEFDNAKQAMQDWEVLAMEERSLRETLSERVAEFEEQLAVHREAHDRIANEREGQNSTIDGLQRALQDIQEARKQELREMVESSQSQLEAIKKQADAAQLAASESAAALEATQQELKRASPFEKEVKEKNLLIGKLRHEAVILNDHLTKALRFLKRGKPEDNVDRQIVTNHFLHFLALDRSDPKKFQILQLIAALLGWTEEQREQAGLARPGASNSQLRVPLSPFRRTPSTPALSTDFGVTSPGGASRESLAELWSDFLEREAQEGGGGSRRSSVATGQRSASMTSPPPGGSSPGLGIKTSSAGGFSG